VRRSGGGAVLIDPAVLDTLPEREYRAGLHEIVKAGIIRRNAKGNQVYFQVNADCPVFNELKSLLMNHAPSTIASRDAMGPNIGRRVA